MAVRAAQPILLLGEIVVRDRGAMQGVQGRAGASKIGVIAEWPRDLERASRNVTAHQPMLVCVEQRRGCPEWGRHLECATFATKQMRGERTAPPRHFVQSAQHRRDVAAARIPENATFHRGKDIALEHDRGLPTPRESIARGPVHRTPGSARPGPARRTANRRQGAVVAPRWRPSPAHRQRFVARSYPRSPDRLARASSMRAALRSPWRSLATACAPSYPGQSSAVAQAAGRGRN